MAYGLSNGHVTDDITWPWKVKHMTPIHLERNISKTADRETPFQIGNGTSAIKWSRDRDVTWPQNVLWGSTVGYLSDTSCLLSLASCLTCRFDQFCLVDRLLCVVSFLTYFYVSPGDSLSLFTHTPSEPFFSHAREIMLCW